MGYRIVVVGIPGVGKSTVIEQVSASLQGKVAVFGTVMFEEARRLKWVKDRDDMRKMTVVRQKRLQKAAAAKIARDKNKVLLIDTHLFIRTPEGFWPGLPFDVIRALKPTHLILVEAKSEEILSRRTNDTTRYRDKLTAQDIEYELSLARSFLSCTSLVSGAPMLTIQNSEGLVDEAAATVVKALQGVVS